LEDLLSVETFNGLTVDTLQNPSGVFVVDVDQTGSNHSSIANGGNGDVQNNFAVQYNSQFQQTANFYGQQFSYASSDNIHSDLVQKNLGAAYVQAEPQYSYLKNFNELADPTANWVAQSTDVTLLERLVSESERFRTVDDILDIVPPSEPSIFNYSAQDKNQILQEIYREAEEISSRRESPAIFSPSSSESLEWSLSTDDQSIDQKIDFDHVFEKSKKSIKPKREAAKQKKKHQNREAALRYRLKKRAEKSAIGEELGGLMERNEFLKSQKSNIASEIAYLKGLLSEVHRKKQIRS